MNKNLNQLREKRKKRTRMKIFGTIERPRLSVFRSNYYTYCQLINDENDVILIGASTKRISEKIVQGTKKIKLAELLGELIAKKAIEKGIKKIIFDKGMYKYHGRVKAVAEGAKKGGLEF
ncbi:MAG: 50S ribosomal protein L18 [Patescibacteria group bacterium]